MFLYLLLFVGEWGGGIILNEHASEKDFREKWDFFPKKNLSFFLEKDFRKTQQQNIGIMVFAHEF